MKNKAFTIIEVVLAVMLTVLVVLSAGAAFRSIRSAQVKTEYYDTVFGQLQLFFNLLSDDLSNINIASGADISPVILSPAGNIADSHDRLLIRRNIDPLSAQSDSTVAVVEYGLLKNNNSESSSIGRRIALLKESQQQNAGGKLTVLTENVKSLRFEFFDGNTWYRSNASQEFVPLIIKVQLELTDKLWMQGSSTITRQIPVYPCIFNNTNNDKTEAK